MGRENICSERRVGAVRRTDSNAAVESPWIWSGHCRRWFAREQGVLSGPALFAGIIDWSALLERVAQRMLFWCDACG
jgi:hypothetical protein